ncbi:MAG: polyamine ABC transporter substrate-binding protein [Devosia sp.]|nr:polyamine ABC transporter substrate-binding protein [Devosia sp.]
MKKSLILAIGAFALAAPFTATLAAADDNVVNLYNWSDYRADDTLTNFTKETGIKVVEANYDSNEMLEGKLVAGHSGFDVVVPSGFFLQHQIPIGLYSKLDKSKLPNLANMDPAVMKATEAFDPGNQYAVDYMWGTTALGYNVDKVKAALGANAPLNSWDLLFKPENAQKLKDCGITILDAPSEVVAIALNYLGLNPNSEKAEDLKKAEDLLTSIKPYVRKFDSSGYIDDLANGDACLSLGYSGDVYIAKSRATDAKKGVNIAYVIPKEGTIEWFDMLAIPADAPHKENALKFINYIMQPKVTADISDNVFYANGNKAAFALTDPAITGDPNIYPPAELAAKLTPLQAHSQDFTRLLTRTWTRIKTGE